MKKILLIGAATLIVSNPTFAGDYLTNTNQNAAFLRMIARGASIDVDGVYSNPAGLAFLPKDGFHLSLTGQSAYQTREILATSPLWTLDGKTTERYYKGTASAPIIPSFHGAYKKDRWVISLHSPSPVEEEKHRSTMDFRCSTPWLSEVFIRTPS